MDASWGSAPVNVVIEQVVVSGAFHSGSEEDARNAANDIGTGSSLQIGKPMVFSNESRAQYLPLKCLPSVVGTQAYDVFPGTAANAGRDKHGTLKIECHLG